MKGLVNGPGIRRVFFSQGRRGITARGVLIQILMILMGEKKKIWRTY